MIDTDYCGNDSSSNNYKLARQHVESSPASDSYSQNSSDYDDGCAYHLLSNDGTIFHIESKNNSYSAIGLSGTVYTSPDINNLKLLLESDFSNTLSCSISSFELISNTQSHVSETGIVESHRTRSKVAVRLSRMSLGNESNNPLL